MKQEQGWIIIFQQVQLSYDENQRVNVYIF